MHCVILAAGRNSRLDTGKPKSLLEINGIALLERHIRNFSQQGVQSFCIITGYQAESIEAKVTELRLKYPVEITTVHNPRYDLENGFSLNAASQWAANQGVQNFFLTMGDHAFEQEFVTEFCALATQQIRDRLYLGVDQPSEKNAHIDIDDVTKVLVNDQMEIESIGKLIPDYNFYDTGLFYLPSEVFEVLETCFAREEYSISHMVNAMTKSLKARVLNVSGFLWNDVDNPADYSTTQGMGLK